MIRGSIRLKETIVDILYGIKLISTWMLIPFLLMFIPLIYQEFSVKFTVADVILEEDYYSSYPDEILCFKTHIDDKERVVFAPVTSKVGDNIKVILKDGDYYKSILDENDYKDYLTFSGRFLRICNNFYGYTVIGMSLILLISFLVTRKKRKEIRSSYPNLTKATDIAGIVCSLILSFLLLYGVIDNTLTSIGLVMIGLVIGIVYIVVFIFGWILVHTLY